MQVAVNNLVTAYNQSHTAEQLSWLEQVLNTGLTIFSGNLEKSENSKMVRLMSGGNKKVQ